MPSIPVSLAVTPALSVSVKTLSTLQNRASNCFGKEKQGFHFCFLRMNLNLKYRIAVGNPLLIENESYKGN